MLTLLQYNVISAHSLYEFDNCTFTKHLKSQSEIIGLEMNIESKHLLIKKLVLLYKWQKIFLIYKGKIKA